MNPFDTPKDPLAQHAPEIIEAFPILHQPGDGLQAPKLLPTVADRLKNLLLPKTNEDHD